MTKRYVVVDQNVMRKSALGEVIASKPDTHFVLPDLSFLEMTKSPQWERTLRCSLKQLALVPQRVHVAHSVNEALAIELNSLSPINGHLLHADATNFVREILAWVATGSETEAIRRIKSDPDNHKDALAVDHLNHIENKARMGDLIDATKRFIPEEMQKLMRGRKLSATEQIDAVHEIAVGLMPRILGERSISKERARSFMKGRPMVLRYLLVRAWYCVHWISQGGFDSLRGADVTNELLDQQYVLTASFFDGLLSEEHRVNESYRDLSLLLRRKV